VWGTEGATQQPEHRYAEAIVLRADRATGTGEGKNYRAYIQPHRVVQIGRGAPLNGGQQAKGGERPSDSINLGGTEREGGAFAGDQGGRPCAWRKWEGSIWAGGEDRRAEEHREKAGDSPEGDAAHREEEMILN